ncbi:hypothetical protein CANARDRAFT_30589 [[Candida] arabinofermentans NRRL YB-2248]|uniref:Probable cytosolic iron-sulfur protein assembly protein 1 n=1 Tax=[Candida] arabinofermentans NRRL YB-2248 TaxID=983967 RepID=A0A1E4STA0_9ASCO|nr:hypothetical protein CANARDRAFT_30589 [[Candida] arabinofermentans NRRL YB-2248]
MALQLQHTFTGHTDKCWSISVHKTLPLLASVSSDKTCRIYNTNTRKLVSILDENTHTKTMRSVAFKPTGDFPSLAIGSFDSTISIWGKDSDDFTDEESMNNTNNNNEWMLLAILEGHENEVKCVDWSFDGTYLASCSRDKSIWIWETDETNEEFECINVIQEHDQDVKYVDWHPARNVLSSCSYDDTCRVYKQDEYDEDDWTCVCNLTGAQGTVWCSDFEDGDGQSSLRLVNCSDDSKVRVWKKLTGKDNENGALPSTLKDEEEWELDSLLPSVHESSVYGVAWSSNGLIASCGSDGKIAVYKEQAKLNSYSNKQESEWVVLATVSLAHGVYEINCVKWGADNQLFTAGDDGNVKLWKLDI